MAKIKKYLNKIELILIIWLSFLCLFSCEKKEELRLRIIASTNSSIDLKQKEDVKNFIKEIFKKDINISCLELEKLLNENFAQKISVKLREETFPAKSYDGHFIPSGTYKTIVVAINEAKGANFWTLLYPSFLDIDFEGDHEIEYRSYILDKLK